MTRAFFCYAFNFSFDPKRGVDTSQTTTGHGSPFQSDRQLQKACGYSANGHNKGKKSDIGMRRRRRRRRMVKEMEMDSSSAKNKKRKKKDREKEKRRKRRKKKKKETSHMEKTKTSTSGETFTGDGQRKSGQRKNVHFFYPLLLVLPLLFALPTSDAGFPCLSFKCHCVFKSNKLIADCIGLNAIPEPLMFGLTIWPECAANSQPSINKIAKKESPPEKSSDIQILNLTQNTLGELKGKAFQEANLVNLQRIYLRRAGLVRVDKLAFFRLTNLIEIDLSMNLLSAVPSEALSLARKLREVDLSGNQIVTVSANTFLHMVNLKVLNLEGNGLRHLERDCFLGLVSLETLKLSDNSLSLIDGSVLRPLGQLHSLTLSSNNWICDCSIRPLRQLLMSRRISVYDQPRCADSPSTIWTQTDVDSLICSPQIVPNNSASSPIFVEPGKSISLECAFYMKETSDLTNLPIQWTWQGPFSEKPFARKSITNNTKGIVTNQVFLVHEFHAPLTLNTNETGRMMKVSRLDISLMLQVNQGVYSCQCSNLAGSAGRNYSVVVAKGAVGVGSAFDSSSSTASSLSSSSLRETAEQSDLQLVSVSDATGTGTGTGTNTGSGSGSKDNPGGHVASEASATVLPLLIGILAGMALVLVTFSLVFATVVPCKKNPGQMMPDAMVNCASGLPYSRGLTECSYTLTSASNCYDFPSKLTPVHACRSITFASCSRTKVTSISSKKSPKISFSASPLPSNAWTQEMHQLSLAAKDEAPTKLEEGEEQVQREEERDERTSEEEVLSSFDFASCTEYSTPLPLLKYQNVTATAATTTSTSTLATTPAQLTREVECAQRNEPDLIHQSRGLKGGC